MTDNKTQTNEVFTKYLETNPEIQKRYANMTPAEKEDFKRQYLESKSGDQKKKNELLRGRNSDEWQNTIDAINEAILKGMQKLPDDFDQQSPEQKRETVNQQMDALTPEENVQFIEQTNQAKKDLLETYPPKRLLAIADKLGELIATTDNQATKQALTSQLNTVKEEIALTAQELANGGIVVDQTNIADVYEGANMLLDYVDNNSNGQTQGLTNQAREKLEAQIKIYDEAHGLADLTEDDKERVAKNYEKGSELSAKLPLDKNIGTMIANLEFMDEKGNPYADNDQKAQKELLIESIKEEAVRNLAGKKDEVSEDALNAEIEKVSTARIGALVMGSEFALAQNPAQAAQIINDLQTKKYQVANTGMIGYCAEYTNSSYGYLDRLSAKIGKTAPVLGKMHEKIKKFDQSCTQRFDPAYTKTKSLLKVMRGNALRAAPMAALGVALTHVQPAGAAIMAGTCVGMAAWRIGSQFVRLKKEAKQKGEKFSAGKFFKDHAFNIALTAASATATAMGMPMLGKAVMGINAARTGIVTFNEKKKEGDKWWKAAGKALAAGSITIGTTYATAMAVGYAMDTSGISSAIDNHFGREIETGVWVEDQGTKKFAYSDENVKAAENFNESPNRHFEYIGKGHTIDDFNNPDNYENRAWFSPEQHDTATKVIHDQMSQQNWADGSEEVMLKKLASFTREYANLDHPLNDGSGRTVGEAFTYKDDSGYSVNPQQLLDKALAGEELNATDGRLLHNLQFVSSPQGHALADVGIKPEELYSYDTGKPHGVLITETPGGGHWEKGTEFVPATPGIFVPAIPYDNQYKAQQQKLAERVGARGHFWKNINKVLIPGYGQDPSQPKDQQKGGNNPKDLQKPGITPKDPQKAGETPKKPQTPGISPKDPSLGEKLNKGVGEPVIDGVNPNDSKNANTVEFGPNYEDKSDKKGQQINPAIKQSKMFGKLR